MTLAQKIQDIQQKTKSHEQTSRAWQHNREAMKVLQSMGTLQAPIPKTYITEGYVSDPRYNVSPFVSIGLQLFCSQGS